MNREIIATLLIPLLLASLFALVPVAKATSGPPRWESGWFSGNDGYGVSADLKQSNNPYVDSSGCCRTSGWVNACTQTCRAFVQVGWYKGTWNLGSCSNQYSSPRVFVEKFTRFVSHTCVLHDAPSMNVYYDYRIKKGLDLGNDVYNFEAWWNNELITSHDIDTDGIALELSAKGEQIDNNTTNLPGISSTFNVLRYHTFGGSQLLWTTHTKDCSNQYNVDKQTNYRVIISGPDSTPLCE